MNTKPNRIVVKVGTSTLTKENGSTDLKAFDHLAYVLSDLHNMGYEIILVSSGAIAMGINKMRIEKRPEDIPMLQATAAVGQVRIMFYYDKFFGNFSKIVSQILLSADDLDDPIKAENLINTFNTLIKNDVIPIVNENDSSSYTEIETAENLFSDNDMLSAIVAILVGASKLIILSDIDGFFDMDPRLHANAQIIKEVTEIDDRILKLAGGVGSRRGTGGMKTKLEAASLAMEQGIDTIITNGAKPEYIYDILEGKSIGTKFIGKRKN